MDFRVYTFTNRGKKKLMPYQVLARVGISKDQAFQLLKSINGKKPGVILTCSVGSRLVKARCDYTFTLHDDRDNRCDMCRKNGRYLWSMELAIVSCPAIKTGERWYPVNDLLSPIIQEYISILKDHPKFLLKVCSAKKCDERFSLLCADIVG